MAQSFYFVVLIVKMSKGLLLRYTYILLLCLIAQILAGQELSLERKVMLHRDQNIRVDSLVIIGDKIRAQSWPDLTPLICIFERDSIFVQVAKEAQYDSIFLIYNVLNIKKEEQFDHVDPNSLRFALSKDYIGFQNSKQSGALLESDGIDYDGSFLRGLSFGNSQSLFLDSKFNLQISGKISDDTEIVAALTDANIPLQANGNTQQLQEFDKIFIQIKNKGKTLTAGDFEIEHTGGHFLRYYKKLKGGALSYAGTQGDVRLAGSINGGLSRGKFNRVPLQTEEGNQGPYRLSGADNERYIVILSGTERVFLDGRLLVRGEEADYTMDYNQALIRFTPNRIITKDSRIIIEYEYRFDIYNRGFVKADVQATYKKLDLGFELYREADGTRPNGQFNYNEIQLEALRQAGDNPQRTAVSSIRALDPRTLNDPVTYRLVDSMGYRVLVQSSDNKQTLYTAIFTDVGTGQGDYIEGDPNINGRVFVWVAPKPDGSKNGRYQPVIKLTGPQEKTIMSINSAVQLGKKSKMRAELSLSNNDLNRLSRLDDQDNNGLAGFLAYDQEIALLKKNNLKAIIQANYEFVGAQFDAIKPFRVQEFTRNWNTIRIDSIQANDGLGLLNIRLQNDKNNLLEYGINIYHKSQWYNGLSHKINISNKNKYFDINARLNILNTSSFADKSNYIKPLVQIDKTWGEKKAHHLTIINEIERNEITDNRTDTLSGFGFMSNTTRYSYTKSNKSSLSIQHIYRLDDLAYAGKLTNATRANELKFSGQSQSKAQSIRWSIHYRKMDTSSPFLDNFPPQENYLGKIQHRINLLKKSIIISNIYELGSGQEERVEVIFIKTPQVGQGQYIHRELTRDNIQQNFEFFIAPFSDLGQYTRVQLGTTEFFRTKNVSINQSIKVDLNKITKNNFIKRIYINSNLLSNTKKESRQNQIVWNPYENNQNSGVILSAERRWKTNIYFNRSNPKYQVSYAYILRKNKNLLTTGFLDKGLNKHHIKIRYNFNQVISSQLSIVQQNRSTNNALFDERDTDIDTRQTDAEVSVFFSQNSRLRTNILYETNFNHTGMERVQRMEAKINFQIRRSNQSSLLFELSYQKISASSPLSPLLQLDLLQGLRTGNNLLWTTQMDINLGKNLRLNLQYNGRKVGTGKLIHTGSAQVGAIF